MSLGKSLKRKPAHAASSYRDGYLKSRAWFARRSNWFNAEQKLRGSVRCAVCDTTLTLQTLVLHHYEYAGVIQRPDGTWIGRERHTDLVAFCNPDHDALHRYLDRDPAWKMLGRRAATQHLVRKMRLRLAELIREQHTAEKSNR